MSFVHVIFKIKMKILLFSCPVKVKQYFQPLLHTKLHTGGPKARKPRYQVITCSFKIVSCFLHILFIDRYRHILFLNKGICTGHIFKQHIVIFLAVFIQFISSHIDQDLFLEVSPIDLTVIDRKLRRCTAVKRI